MSDDKPKVWRSDELEVLIAYFDLGALFAKVPNAILAERLMDMAAELVMDSPLQAMLMEVATRLHPDSEDTATDDPAVEQTFHTHWEALIAPGGIWQYPTIKRVLHDYHRLMMQIALLRESD